MINEKLVESFQPGQFTTRHAEVLVKAAELGLNDPSYLSDLEGAGPIYDLEMHAAKNLGVDYALALSSCTAAIHTALLAMGIGPGDEVITTPYSWGQTVSPVLFTRATAVFADIDPMTLCIDPELVKERITKKTKAILPVHLFGGFVEIDTLSAIAAKHDIKIIADAAHAMGANLSGKTAAQYGDVACFSLGRGKLVSGGEGGLLATNNRELFEKAVGLSQHPGRARREMMRDEFERLPQDLGYNYRMHPLAAVLALADFEESHQKLQHRKAVKTQFINGLGASSGNLDSFVARKNKIVKQEYRQVGHAAYGLSLSLQSPANANMRQKLIELAQERGIPLRSGPVRTPLHLRVGQGNFLFPVKHHWTHLPGSCPVAEEHCKDRELWVFSAIDQDSLTPKESYAMGSTFAQVMEPFPKNSLRVH